MKKMLAALIVVFCPAFVQAQTIGVVNGGAVAPANDFATRAFQDPWDMNERTDLGWWVNSVDGPNNGFNQPVTFSGGVFSGVTANADPSIFLLESGSPFAAQVGKIGLNYPIDADTYKIIAFRMSVTTPSAVQFYWNRDTIYDTTTTQAGTGGTTQTTPGYRIYLYDLSTLPTQNIGANGFTWGGTVKSLRMDPTVADPAMTGPESIALDWVRLLPITPSLCKTVNWTGGNVDIYVTDTAGTSLGKIASNVAQNSASPGCTATGTGHAFFVGALAPGTYRVGVSGVGGTAPTSISQNNTAGTWVVSDTPTLTFTSPDPEGSSDDFATTQLGNAWDMTAMNDLDSIVNIDSGALTTALPLETPAGSPSGSPSVFRGTSWSSTRSFTNEGDPYVRPLCASHPALLCTQQTRGNAKRIAASRYRILTLEMGLPDKARDIVNGSIARVVWHVVGDAAEQVSDDIIVNSRIGANVVDKITVDMGDRAKLPLEPGPSQAGWVGSIDGFRVDPHEFSNPTDFFIKRVKLAAFERADTSYTIRWDYADASSGSVDLYYSGSVLPACSNGTLIATAVSTGATGQFVWNTTNVPAGSVFICAVFRDAQANANESWAKWPIIINHGGALSSLAVNRSVLNFGITQGTLRTSAQTVRVAVSGGNACWTVDNTLPSAFVVTLAGGVSQICGSGSFSVALNPSNPFPGGIGQATLSVRETVPGTSDNSPLTVTSFYRVLGASSGAVGVIDTPADGATISGSVPVTGWAIDDIDIVSVGVYRDPLPGEGPAPVFIGNATRVDDARGDIEAANPAVPFNYRAGWGYLMLSNFLPGGGEGTFVLRILATDREGRQTLIGSPRTVFARNSISAKPFGAIDTPGQGEVINGGTSYINFGWVLVRKPAIATPGIDGHAVVNVVIDGVAVGTPGGWTSRADLDALFDQPTYPGIPKAAGNFTFNPSALGAGVHTIAWGVIANSGDSDGIGSRFFTVAPASGVVLDTGSPDVIAAQRVLNPGPDLGRRVHDVGPIDTAGPRLVTARPDERIVVDAARAGIHRYDAYLVAGSELRARPVGASFDTANGVLYWQPTLGYTGAYDFVIVGEDRTRVPVRVVLDSSERRTAPRMFAHLFSAAD